MLQITKQGDYQEVMKEISSKGFPRPTSAQIISVLDTALRISNNDLYDRILEFFNNNYLWTCTEHIALPNKGIFIYDNIKGEIQDIEKIEEMHKYNTDIRFVPYGFQTGHMTLEEYISNPLVTNHFGKEAMKSVKEVAQSLKGTPYVSAPLDITQPKKSLCAILTDKTTQGLALHGAGTGTGKEGYAVYDF